MQPLLTNRAFQIKSDQVRTIGNLGRQCARFEDGQRQISLRREDNDIIKISVTPKAFDLLGMTVFSFSPDGILNRVEVYSSKIDPEVIDALSGKPWHAAQTEARCLIDEVIALNALKNKSN